MAISVKYWVIKLCKEVMKCLHLRYPVLVFESGLSLDSMDTGCCINRTTSSWGYLLKGTFYW